MMKTMMAMMMALILCFPTMAQEKEKPKKESVISIQFRITEESKIFVGKKAITMDMIPEKGTILELEIKGDFIVKIVFGEPKN